METTRRRFCFGQFFFGLLGIGLATKNNRERAFQIRCGGFTGLFNLANLHAAQAELLARFCSNIAS